MAKDVKLLIKPLKMKEKQTKRGGLRTPVGGRNPLPKELKRLPVTIYVLPDVVDEFRKKAIELRQSIENQNTK